MSAAYPYLRDLKAGDIVPSDLYVLDYRDGKRPRWRVETVEEMPSGGRLLVLVDLDNGADDLFALGAPVCLQVITHENKTLRTQPYMRGSDPLPMLCDFDQQGRRAAKAEAHTR